MTGQACKGSCLAQTFPVVEKLLRYILGSLLERCHHQCYALHDNLLTHAVII